MLAHDRHHGVVSLLAGPVALPFQHNLLPSHWNGSSLHHALHGIIVRLFRSATGGIGHHVDLISTFDHRAQCKAVIAALGPRPETTTLLRPFFLRASRTFISSQEFIDVR